MKRMSFDDVIRLCGNLTDVQESLSYGTPALKVRGKLFCRLWGDRDYHKANETTSDVLRVFCDLAEKEILLDDSDGSIFTAPHYDGHGAVLVRLALVTEVQLNELLHESYWLRAPAAMRRQRAE
jgi:hypothetical protein